MLSQQQMEEIQPLANELGFYHAQGVLEFLVGIKYCTHIYIKYTHLPYKAHIAGVIVKDKNRTMEVLFTSFFKFIFILLACKSV